MTKTVQEKLQKPKTSSQKSCGICFATKYPSQCFIHAHASSPYPRPTTVLLLMPKKENVWETQ